jgi:DegV family protein with EDD domain
MEQFVIITDATCDLPSDFTEKENISVVNMNYTIENETFSTDKTSLPLSEFYSKMRNGKLATTTLINPATAKEAIEKHLKNGKDVLYIAFSSALSGSCQSAFTAANELKDKYENKVAVIDSLCASLGEGLLVYYANEYKKQGKSLAETAEYIENLKRRICHYFTVNDLFHLHRGGRLTKGKALVGSLLHIKPILYVNDEGRLIPLKNSMGRKKSLMELVSCMEKKVTNPEGQIVFISHGDCKDDAYYLAEKVKEKFGITDFMINTIGPIVGSHSGPGTVALFFVGKDKIENKE